MDMKFLKAIGLMTGLLWCMGLQADLVAVQEAIEAYDISIDMHGTGKGYMLVRACDSCKPVRIGIDSNTAVRIDGNPVKTSRHIEGKWSGGVVIYDTKSRVAVRLSLIHPSAGS
jgi:RNA polymerase subunit RPABC4/transcription elongation factor Spt4